MNMNEPRNSLLIELVKETKIIFFDKEKTLPVS